MYVLHVLEFLHSFNNNNNCKVVILFVCFTLKFYVCNFYIFCLFIIFSFNTKKKKLKLNAFFVFC